MFICLYSLFELKIIRRTYLCSFDICVASYKWTCDLPSLNLFTWIKSICMVIINPFRSATYLDNFFWISAHSPISSALNFSTYIHFYASLFLSYNNHRVPTEPGNREKAGNSKINTPGREKTLNLTWYEKIREITGKTVSAL